jgi:hypothetical protein
MARITYIRGCIKKCDLPIILKANPILEEYARDGFKMTLRQLHYQFVSRGYMPNTKPTYTKICESMQRGRMGGMVDWSAVVDLTRVQHSRSCWIDPANILDACADHFHVDFWQDQSHRVEVWIEKDALLGVIEQTCHRWDTPSSFF